MDRRGFTLVELLVALAIGAILLTIAIPGYAFLVNGSRLTALTNDLVAALHLARSEAIKRGMRVTICKTGGAMTAPPSCNHTAGWQQGWLVFADGGTKGVIDTGDAILWAHDRVVNEATISPSNYDSYISYLPSGKSQAPGGLPNGYFHICVAGSRRDVIINSSGRPRLHSATC